MMNNINGAQRDRLFDIAQNVVLLCIGINQEFIFLCVIFTFDRLNYYYYFYSYILKCGSHKIFIIVQM